MAVVLKRINFDHTACLNLTKTGVQVYRVLRPWVLSVPYRALALFATNGRRYVQEARTTPRQADAVDALPRSP